MMYVNIPNSPKNAKVVIVARNTPDKVVKGLKNSGISVIFGGKSDYKVDAVNYHIDTQIYHVNRNKFVVSPHLFNHYKNALPDAEIIVGESVGQGPYPSDAAYNVARIGNKVIHNFNFTDKILLSHIKDEKIQVSQGYSKCSLCIVDENSVITEDIGIATILERHNINVLKISAGDVSLPGLNYGFLGGASGKLSTNILGFAGNIKEHRNYSEILRFCTMRNVEIVSLSDEKLIDVGSIIPIIEKE